MSSGQFSYINAKLRARLTGRLNHELFEALIKTPTIEEALPKLKGSNYSLLSETYEKTGDLRLAEMAMAEKEIDLFTGLRSGLQSANRNFIDSLLMRLEINNIKNVMGSWYTKAILKRGLNSEREWFLRKTILTPLPYNALLNAPDFDTFVMQFAKTPYEQVLNETLEVIKKDNSIFKMGLTLDLFYYKHLRRTLTMLNGDSRFLASSFFGAEIDFENIISKLRETSIKKENPSSFFIEGGNFIGSPQNLENVVSNRNNIEAFLTSRYPRLNLDNVEYKKRTDIELVELCRDSELTARAKALRGKQPFSVASTIAYFYLMKHDNNLIISILEGHHYKMSEEKIREMLCF